MRILSTFHGGSIKLLTFGIFNVYDNMLKINFAKYSRCFTLANITFLPTPRDHFPSDIHFCDAVKQNWNI